MINCSSALSSLKSVDFALKFILKSVSLRHHLFSMPEYHVLTGLILSNEREVKSNGKVTYMPIYYVMFLNATEEDEKDIYF